MGLALQPNPRGAWRFEAHPGWYSRLPSCGRGTDSNRGAFGRTPRATAMQLPALSVEDVERFTLRFVIGAGAVLSVARCFTAK